MTTKEYVFHALRLHLHITDENTLKGMDAEIEPATEQEIEQKIILGCF